MLPRAGYITAGIFIFLSVYLDLFSQQIPTDTAFIAASRKKTVSLYTASIQHQSRLYNGTDYVLYFSKDEEHPYFKIDDWTNGSIVYWGELYENVPLIYDLSVDQVITEHNRGNPIKLIAEKVDAFTLSGHTFQRLRGDANNKITEGFYDRLYDGTSKVYAKHQKVYREDLTAKEVIPRFEENTRYFVLKKGVMNPVKTKASILEIFNDQKQQIKNYIKKNRIRFKNNRDVAFVRVTEFYDSLTD